MANVDVKQDVVDAAVEKLLAAQEALERKDGAFAFEYDDFTFTMTTSSCRQMMARMSIS